MADRKGKGRKFRSPKLTRIEKLTKGLMAKRDPSNIFTVKEVPGKGRGVFLRAEILRKDSYVLEYEGDVIPENQAHKREKIYAHNNEGCYIMYFRFQGKKLALDATREFNSLARLMNHSLEPNVKFHPPFVIDLKGNLPRLASYALKNIYKGEELVIDYGVRDGHISWLRNREIGFTENVDSDSSVGSDCTSRDDSLADCVVSRKESSGKPISPNYGPSCSASSDVTSALRPTQTSANKRISMGKNINNDSNAFSKKEWGARFTRILRGGKSYRYFASFENIRDPEKIVRCIDDDSSKRKRIQSDAESVVCISTSSSSVNSRSETSSAIVDITSDIELPSNKEPDSIHKVLEWQTSTMPLENGTSIQIVNVQSLCDSPEKEIIVQTTPDWQQKNSLYQVHTLSLNSLPYHSQEYDLAIPEIHQYDYPFSTASSPLPPLSSSASKNIEELLCIDISESDAASNVSSDLFATLPRISLGPESSVGKINGIEPVDMLDISDDECVPETTPSEMEKNSIVRKITCIESAETLGTSGNECLPETTLSETENGMVKKITCIESDEIFGISDDECESETALSETENGMVRKITCIESDEILGISDDECVPETALSETENGMVRKITCIESDEILGISDDECVPETALSEKQQNSMVGEITSIESAETLDISVNVCVPEIALSEKQQNSFIDNNLIHEECSDNESSCSSSVCEITFTEVHNSSNDSTKVVGALPARRPVGFSSPSTKAKVAVIKPYVSPKTDEIPQMDAVSLTESDLEQLKILSSRIIFSNAHTGEDIQHAINTNWHYFSELVQRGISIQKIRSTFLEIMRSR